MSQAKQQLDSSIDPEKQRLKDALGDSAEDTEILGYGVCYGVGSDWNCMVPRKWLVKRAGDLGIPDYILPSQVSEKRAYNRAIKRMREDDHMFGEVTVEAPRLDDVTTTSPHKVMIDLRDGDGTDIYHLHAAVFFSEDESKQEGGTWDEHYLGRFGYDHDAESPTVSKNPELKESDLLFSVWEDLSAKLRTQWGQLQHVHHATDIRNMMYAATGKHSTNVIKLKRSIYLFPAGMTDFVDSMSQLYDEINDQFKRRGDPVAIRTFELLDTDDKRSWVESEVEATIRESVDKIVAEALDDFDEGDAANTVVKTIKESLSGDLERAEVYNSLLQAELDVEEALKEKKADLADSDHEDIVETVLTQTTADDY